MATLADLLALIGNPSENAYQNLAATLAQIGGQEAQTGIDYERQKAEAGYSQEDAVRKLRDALANRGMNRSGMAIRGEADIGRNYTSILDQLARARQSTLSDLAGRRLQAEGSFNQTMANLQADFAGKSTEFIAAQMEADAQRRANAQDQVFQQYMMGLNQQTQTAQQNFYKQQQDQMSGLTNAFTAAVTPTTTTAPTAAPKASAPTTTPRPTVTQSRSLTQSTTPSYLLPSTRIGQSAVPRQASSTANRIPI